MNRPIGRPPLYPNLLADIRALARKGLGAPAMAKRLGVSANYIRRLIRTHHLDVPDGRALNRVDPVLDDAILSAYRSGDSIKVIAFNFEVSHSCVIRAVRRQCVPLRSPRLTGLERSRIIALHRAGHAVPEIMRRTKRSRTAVNRVLATCKA